MLWVCGAVMRESDQASLLDGALQLARGLGGEARFHNYSGQFGSYWLLAGLQHLFPLDSLRGYVIWGNYVACGMLVIGLLFYALKMRKEISGQGVVLLIISLTTPTVLLSAPLLSSNIMAGGVILALVATSGWWQRWAGIALGSVLVFLAVSLRQDAAFLLPLICFIPQKDLRFWVLLRERYLWCFMAAAVGALLTGRVLSAETYFPGLVLDWKLVGCYAVFGLLGAGLALIWGVMRGWKRASDVMTRLVISLSVLLPALMYALLLYSPRHLFMAGLVPLLLAASSWLRVPARVIENAPRFPLKRLLLSCALGVNILWLVIAPAVQGNGSVKWGVKHATCYPTADGLWPIGGGIHFLSRLKHADKEYLAIDHNQEVWGAWEDWEPTEGLEKYVFSSAENLNAYLYLWGQYYGAPSLGKGKLEGFPQIQENGIQLVQSSSDRGWVGVGNRQISNKESAVVEEESLFHEENVVSSSRNRLLFMEPSVVKLPTDGEVLTLRAYLLEAHPGVEFLSCLERKDDGHIYVEVGGALFRSNYPEVLLRFF